MKLSLLFLSTLFLLPNLVFGLSQDINTQNFRLGVRSGLVQFQSSGADISAVDMGLDGRLALTPVWLLNVSASQAYLFDDLQPAYTSLALGAEYMVWGRTYRSESSLSMAGRPLLSRRQMSPPGLSFMIEAKQYYFNGSQSVYPLTGLGLCSRGQMASRWAGLPYLLFCYESLSGSSNSVSGLKLFLGLDFFLGREF